MSKLTVNTVKHIDAIEEALETLKKPLYKNVGEFGKYIASLKSPTYEQKALIVYSVLDMIEYYKKEYGEINNEKLIAIMDPIAKEVNIPVQELLKVLVHLLSDVQFFGRTNKAFKELFIANKPS